jgi:hypothetical protein
MRKDDRETLRHISGTLDEILAVLSKPPSRIQRVLDMAITIIGILGILGAIDIVKNWIGRQLCLSS